MDEVENPSLPAAGEASPTLRPIEEDEDSGDPGSPTKPPLDTVEADAVLDHGDAKPSSPLQLPPRPPILRENSVPPPQQPPPAPPPENGEFPQDPPDSLTLADLKRIRSTFPNAQTPAKERLEQKDYDEVYDFEYADAQSLPVEIEEWFSYSEEEKERLRRCREAFNKDWRATEEGKSCLDVTEDVRRAFVSKKLACLTESHNAEDDGSAVTALEVLTYLGLGVWEETAGRQDGDGGTLQDLLPGTDRPGSKLGEYEASSVQLQWIVSMVDTLHACDGLQVIYSTLRSTCEADFEGGNWAVDDYSSPIKNEGQLSRPPSESTEMWCALTLLYLFVEVARSTQSQKLRKDIAALEPNLLIDLTQLIGRLRWEENLPVPVTKLLLLSWKTVLVTLGGLADLEEVKINLGVSSTAKKNDEKDEKGNDEDVDERGQPLITASPLDYHLFRQEISSKYPAYAPPAPLFPLEPENNSILPPLKHRQPSYSAAPDLPFTGGAPTSVGTGSIMHAPLHIATPAPSPPPSPAAGAGKAGGKKQNYQTNQMFPFLYPPLDSTSNDLGGKGSTELQDVLVGRKWEGGDIPASILEAAELFAQRVRGTRGMRQLWGVRGGFMRQERGWQEPEQKKSNEGVGNERKESTNGLMTWEELKNLEGLEDLDLNGVEDSDDDSDEDNEEDVEQKETPSDSPDEDFEILNPPEPSETAEQGQPLPQNSTQRRLDAVETFYRDSLPHMQSVIIVLLKAVLNQVTELVTKSGNGLGAGIQFPNENGIANSAKPVENGIATGDYGAENTAEEVDRLRSQEIAAKALSGFTLVLLKWFKVCHILQYEYLTQLLLDSNYVPLILKLWQAEDVGRSVHFRVEQDGGKEGFFGFCGAEASPAGKTEEKTEEESEDEAMPPPIKLKRDSPRDESSGNPLSPGAGDFTHPNHPPEVDELGYPMTPLPATPIQNYSWRNVFTHINYLRILQKVTRRKTHRALMLVQYKSSNHLKKSLRVPIWPLRYYTLKLFKSQVPFCGRKWRQGNMKIITAVWLSVPAELRDDWLSGGGGGMGGNCVLGDVDGSVEDAVPLEQSLRNLTYWWNVQKFGDAMGGQKGLQGEEVSFFERELAKMGGVEEGGGEMEERMEGVGEGWAGPIEGY